MNNDAGILKPLAFSAKSDDDDDATSATWGGKTFYDIVIIRAAMLSHRTAADLSPAAVVACCVLALTFLTSYENCYGMRIFHINNLIFGLIVARSAEQVITCHWLGIIRTCLNWRYYCVRCRILWITKSFRALWIIKYLTWLDFEFAA